MTVAQHLVAAKVAALLRDSAARHKAAPVCSPLPSFLGQPAAASEPKEEEKKNNNIRQTFALVAFRYAAAL